MVPVLDLLGSEMSYSHQGLVLSIRIWISEHICNAAICLKVEVELVRPGVQLSLSRMAFKTIIFRAMFIRLLDEF